MEQIKAPSLSLHPAGDTLFQMAEVHRQIQVQLEETVSTVVPSASHCAVWEGRSENAEREA